MAVLTSITRADAEDLLAEYDLGTLVDITGIAGGSVNSNFMLDLGVRRVFLRVYEEQDASGAVREAAMLERLAHSGVPTPAPLHRRDGQLVSVTHEKPAALFPWREGTICCQAGVTANLADRLGEALARVHAAGREEPVQRGRFGFESLGQRLDSVERSEDARLVALVPTLRAALWQTHASRKPGLPGGLIHGDLFRDNVLWDSGGSIAALLDFESACAGSYAYDFMVCVLSWCFGSDFEPELGRAMRRGYERIRPLTEPEREALVVEGSFAALRFTITRITDYALRTGGTGPRVIKDWRRFYLRFERLRALGKAGLREVLGA
jgi:homoserine kinase type II